MADERSAIARWLNPTPPSVNGRDRMRAITAAATTIDISTSASVALVRRREEWQEECWHAFDTVGEVKYAAGTFLGGAMSRIDLYVGLADNSPEGVPTPVRIPAVGDDPVVDGQGRAVPAADIRTAIDTLERLAAPSGGHGEILAELATNLTVAGECYLWGRQEDDDEEWDVRSVDEVTVDNEDNVYVSDKPTTGQDKGRKVNDDDEYLIRIWRRHPRWSGLSDSPLRGVLSSVEELLIMEQAVRSIGRSRLNAGIMKVPEELSYGPADPTMDEGDGEADEDPFLRDLMEAMTTPIQNEGSASAVVPMLVKGKAEHLKELTHLIIERPFDEQIEVRTERALRRLAQGLNVPVEVITGMADLNHWCVSDDTEVLTRDRGWITQDQLEVGDEVRTIDHDTGRTVWEPVQDIYRADVADEPMVEMESRTHSSVTTPNHRWPVVNAATGRREWRTTETLGATSRITTGAPAADLPTEPKWSDALVELVGWFWTEGNITADGRRVSIAQSHTVNAPRVDRIRAALLDVYGDDGWREVIQTNESSHGGPVTVFHIDSEPARLLLQVAPDKRPTVEFIDQLTASQLRLFIDTSCAGDGQHWRSGRRDIWQRDPQSLDAYERACVLAGYATSRQAAHEDGTRVAALNSNQVAPVKAAEQSRRDGTDGATVRQVSYTGTIWCPVTGNQTWLARHNGRTFYTGNTAWQVEDSTFRSHLAPLAEMIVNALTVGYFHPLLQAAGVDRPERFVIWYEPSRLVARTNVADNAIKARDRGAIDNTALRTALGFTDDDAPTDVLADEAVVKALEMVTAAPSLVQSPGLPLLVEQIRAVLDGTAPPPLPEPETTDAAGVDQPDGDDPQTDPTPDSGPVVAAGPPRVDPMLGDRLARIDRDLRIRLQTAADATMQRALEKAGANIRSRAKQDRSTTDAISGVDNDRVAATLGPSVVQSLGADELDLLDGAFDQMRPRFVKWVRQAQYGAIDLVPGLDDASRDLARQELDGFRDDAWTWFAEALVEAAKDRLYDPDPEPDELGEFDGMLVDLATVREAVARAGGAFSPQATVTAAGLDTLGATFGIATGPYITSTLSGQGVQVDGWQWVYGPFPRERGFEPHARLDGTVFARFDDPVLANPNSWPPEPFFIPGDHRGCLCDVAPVTIDLADTDGPQVDVAPTPDAGPNLGRGDDLFYTAVDPVQAATVALNRHGGGGYTAQDGRWYIHRAGESWAVERQTVGADGVLTAERAAVVPVLTAARTFIARNS